MVEVSSLKNFLQVGLTMPPGGSVIVVNETETKLW